MFTDRDFWIDAAERAVRAAANAALSVLAVGTTTGLLSTDWAGVLSIAGGAAVSSVLLSIVAGTRDGTMSPASALKLPQEPTGRHARTDEASEQLVLPMEPKSGTG